MSQHSYRQIIRFAMENEVAARNFYRDAAKKLKDPGLKDIFTGLAEEEQRHFDTLQNLLKSEAAVQALGQCPQAFYRTRLLRTGFDRLRPAHRQERGRGSSPGTGH